MKSGVKTALGIDITETQVAAVLLGRTSDGLRVQQAGRVPLPEGTFVHGRLVDSRSLLDALKTLRTQHDLRAKDVALSLTVRGVLVRVIPLEAMDPQAITDFVAGEVREYAAFSGRDTVSDYRVLTSATHDTAGKVLVTAIDREAVSNLVGTCRHGGVQARVVEPAVVACARVLNHAPVASGQGRRLLALRKNGTLTLCVWHNGTLDFIRTEPMETSNADTGEWMAREVNTVIQFYDVQRGQDSYQWSVVIVNDDGEDISACERQTIEATVRTDNVQFCDGMTSPATFAGWVEHRAAVSVTAMGLALRLLEDSKSDLQLNLLPQEAGGAQRTKRRTLIFANALAAVIPVAVLAAGGLSYTATRAYDHTAGMRHRPLERGDRELPVAITELTCIEASIAEVTAELECLDRVSESRYDLNWARLLTDIKSAIPSAVRITELSLRSPSEIRIEGISKTHEAVDVFLAMLNQSDQIRNASLLQKRYASPESVVTRYVIRCNPARGEAY